MTYAHRTLSLIVCFVASVLPCPAYSVFTHEQLIDLTWNTTIQPLLRARFPQATAAQLLRAHSYAYGGCAIQDLGYYPFGKKFFSDLTHYVRTGDFIASLLRNARDIDEYAFALGALSHAVGDTIGHEDAVNPATSLDFPKLAEKFGPAVTYDQNPHAHVRTEFGFDIDQLSKHRLAPGAYLRFVGLRVSPSLLEKAVFETYALHLHELLGSRRPTFHSYEWAVRSFLPRVAYAETVIHREEFTADATGETLRVYGEHLAQADFQNVWQEYRKRPGFKTYLMALLLRIVPKFGPLALADICIPNAETDQLYIQSINHSVDEYARLLKQLGDKPNHFNVIDNRDLDTGRKIRPGEYPLTDETFSKLVNVLANHSDRNVPEGLRSEIKGYFTDPGALSTLKLKPEARRKLLERSSALSQGEN